jgi:hypothetical protein
MNQRCLEPCHLKMITIIIMRDPHHEMTFLKTFLCELIFMKGQITHMVTVITTNSLDIKMTRGELAGRNVARW